MNNRHKELYNQAKNGEAVYSDIDFFLWYDRVAELIVRECAEQCTTDGPFVAEVVWGKQFHKKILEHFGLDQ